MLIKEEDYLEHYGTPRRSGRYPWGSGGDDSSTTRNMSFLDTVAYLHQKGVSNLNIAKGMKMTTSELKNQKSIQKNAQKQADINMAERLREKGMSPGEIGKRMAQNGVPRNESSIRALLEPGAKDKAAQLTNIAGMLERAIAEKGPVQIGVGVENSMGISNDKLKIAVAIMKEKGYEVGSIQTPQMGTSVGQKTTIKYLAPQGTKYSDLKQHPELIRNVTEYSTDHGRSSTGFVSPIQINSKRIGIRYAEDGGDKADGVIFVRPGLKDLSMGASRYAQVRIAVDGTHYLKGMAMYKDGLSPGHDLEFNTNKSKSDIGSDKHAAMKKVNRKKDGSVDKENPFTSMISRQITVKDKHGKDVTTSAMNMVNEEGDWQEWSNSLSSQMLSKQHPPFAKEQLGKKFEKKKTDLEEIRNLTNPTVRKKLLETFAAGADSSALHLQAAAIRGQGNHVILPIDSLKETEIYAPNFNNGERVVLIRHPHGGLFEIPELTVNNKHPESRRLLGSGNKGAADAVGINSKVAKRLSGADFDGDTVLVIPNNNRKIKTKPALSGLKNFDPIHEYRKFEGMKIMTPENKGMEMGKISNLITDMTIKRASLEEISRAVKHSMVVIDAEKHELNYKQSALDNNINQLKKKYQQRGTRTGASTLISLSTSRVMVPNRKPRRANEGGPIDKVTGKKMYTPTNESYPKYRYRIDPSTGKKVPIEGSGKQTINKTRSQKMTETDNAHTLSSGTLIEEIYANHANALKDLANQARREAVNTKHIPYSPSARIAYVDEVKSLNAKLSLAISNKPLERQAQALAYANIEALKQSNHDMDNAEIKKLSYKALKEARDRVGAKKEPVEITPKEWEAIQAGAITVNNLEGILNNTKLETIKELAMPRVKYAMSTAKQSRARAMLARGVTQAEVAKVLGVSVSTLRTSLAREGG